jgi:hypothetical protein
MTRALVAAALGAVAAGSVPLPSASQLAWTQYEVGVMISYEFVTQVRAATRWAAIAMPSRMAVLPPSPAAPPPRFRDQFPNITNPQYFCLGAGGSGGWVPPPSLFNPQNLSTDQVREDGEGGGARLCARPCDCIGWSVLHAIASA